MKKQINSLAGATIAVAALTTLTTGVHAAQQVPTPFGDPFPEGSFVIMRPATPFSTPFGFVESILLSRFGDNTPVNLGGGDYQYTDTTVQFTNNFLDVPGGKIKGNFVGTIKDPGFVSVISDRQPSLVAPGTFNAELIFATFMGTVFDTSGNVLSTDFITRINPEAGFQTLGTATFTGNVPDQLVETSFNVRGQFSEDGINFTDTPDLTAVSNPTDTPPPLTTVPEPSAVLSLAVLGFGGLLRKKVGSLH